MRKYTKALSLLLAGTMVLSLAGCGGGSTGGGTEGGQSSGSSSSEISNAVANGKVVYTDTEVDFGELSQNNSIYEISYMKMTDDKIYGYGFFYDPAVDSQVDFLCSFNHDGSDIKITPLELEYDGYTTFYSNYAIDDEGNIYFIKQTMSENGFDEPEYDEAEEDEEGEVDFETEDFEDFFGGEETFTLIKMDQNGQMLWEQEIKFESSGDEYDYPAVYGLISSEKYGLFVSTSSGVLKYDPKNGDAAGKLEGNEDMSQCQMLVMKNGDILILYNNGEGYKYTLLDAESDEMTEPEVSPSVRIDYNYNVYAGRNSDLILTDANGIYTYNFGDDNMVEIVNFIGTEMDVNYVSSLVEGKDGTIVIMVTESTTGLQKLHVLTPVDASTIKERKELKLSCYYMDANTRRQIIDFNKNNEEYKIIATDYSKYDVYSDDISSASQGSSQFNTDIISGNVPDIVILSGDMHPENYVGKGIFEDMTSYLEKDPELAGREFLTNVFDAVNPWGGLYVMTPSFTLEAMLGKTELIGDGISPDELLRLADSKGVAYKDIFTFEPKSTILYYALKLNGSEFIDLASGKCRFDSDEFIRLLEFTNKFPTDYSEETEENYDAYETYYRDDRALMAMSYLVNFESYKEALQATFGADVSVTGFPSENKTTACVSPDLRICMSSTSSEKDGAWQFIRSFLTDSYQETIYKSEFASSFPVSVSALDSMAEESTQQKYYKDEYGLEQPDNPIASLGGVDIELSPLKEEEAQKLVDIIKKVDHTSYDNYEVMDIIAEEAESYWNGIKSSREVADIIQSRISIFINESN